MRKQRDAENTRERVLRVAEKLFADQGFSGTSLAMISQESGISDGLILHHFQSKKNLYHCVLDLMAERYTHLLQQAQESITHPEEMIRQTLTDALNFWKQDATYNRISLWAYLERQTEFSDREAILTVNLARVFEQLQEKKIIDSRFSPVMFLNTIIGSIHFWVRYRETYRTTLNLRGSPDDLDQVFLEQLILLVREMALPAVSNN